MLVCNVGTLVRGDLVRIDRYWVEMRLSGMYCRVECAVVNGWVGGVLEYYPPHLLLQYVCTDLHNDWSGYFNYILQSTFTFLYNLS